MTPKPDKPAKAAAKADKTPKADKPAKAAKPGKRPKISYIMIHFEDRPPIVIDPKKTNCLVWDDQGADILAAFYRSIGRDADAVAVERLWHKGKPLAERCAGTGEDDELPGAIGKHPECSCDPLP